MSVLVIIKVVKSICRKILKIVFILSQFRKDKIINFSYDYKWIFLTNILHTLAHVYMSFLSYFTKLEHIAL